MKLKALIFDVDGTLADTEEAHRSAFNEAFRQMGLDWNWSKPKYAHLLLTTGGKERIAAFIDSLQLPSLEHRTMSALIPEIHRAKTGNFTRMVLAGRVPLRDGVLRLIEEARKMHVALAIASTTTLANIEALLTINLGVGAMARFAVIGAGDQVERKKPAPDIYDLVLRELKLPAEECVAFEDSGNGLQAAKGAGLYTIVTPSFWTQSDDFSTADLVLPSLGSAERPLMPRAATLVGNSMLSIRDVERHLNTIREYQ